MKSMIVVLTNGARVKITIKEVRKLQKAGRILYAVKACK